MSERGATVYISKTYDRDAGYVERMALEPVLDNSEEGMSVYHTRVVYRRVRRGHVGCTWRHWWISCCQSYKLFPLRSGRESPLSRGLTTDEALEYLQTGLVPFVKT